jgi:hypothetical protein
MANNKSDSIVEDIPIIGDVQDDTDGPKAEKPKAEKPKTEKPKTEKPKDDDRKVKKEKGYQLIGAGRFNASYLDHVIERNEVVPAGVVPDSKMAGLISAGLFKALLLVLMLGAFSLGTSSAIAQTTGVNFTYQSKIGWGGAYLQTLPTVLDAIDDFLTSIGSATTLTTNLASTAVNKGASMIGVRDTAGYFSGTTAETVLAELGLFDTSLSLTTTGNGASKIGIADDGSYFTGTTVESALQESGL